LGKELHGGYTVGVGAYALISVNHLYTV